MKQWFIVSILVMSNFYGYSQIGSLGFEINYHKYSLGNFKNFRDEIVNALPVSGKITENFPAYIGFKGSYSNTFRNYKFSVFFGYNSTGGRISYSDYSGKLLIDQVLDIYSTGIQLYIPLYQKNNYFLYVAPKSSIAFTTIKFAQIVEINSEVQKENEKLKSTSIGFGIELSLSKKIKFIEIVAECGFDYYIPSEIYLYGNKDSYLVDMHNNKVKCELEGWRTGIGLRFDLDDFINRHD
jgi:hypothetical protein